MCGIHGIISYSLSREEIENRLREMGTLQHHRGPDDSRENLFIIPGGFLGLGFVRLSILDLDTGMQPLISPADKRAIICNGQIYNYIELRSQLKGEPFVTKGDIEAALNLYRVRGLDFLNELNGMYAGAIFDPLKNKVILFRDRFGIKPLYYTEWKGNFLFSSEIKPLLAVEPESFTLNTSRLATYFTYRFIPGEETMFRGIKRLPPGSFLEYDLSGRYFTIRRYWDYRLDRINEGISKEGAMEEFYRLFSDAVRIRLRSDVEVGSLISSGIDSSAVASKAVELKPDLKLFTISFNEPGYNELPYVNDFLEHNKIKFRSSAEYSKLCGKETLWRLPAVINSLEEPVSLGTVIPTDQVCELAGEHLKVVLTGEGADEIFAGYRKFLIEAAAAEFECYSRADKKKIVELYPEIMYYLKIRSVDPVKRYIQSEILFNKGQLEILLGREIQDVNFPDDALPYLSGSEHPLNSAIAFEARSRLPDYVILRLDKLSMRHSLETRTPFLDYRIAEFASSLPIELKLDTLNNMEKLICREAFFKYSVLDRDTAFRKKQPFTIPLADWLSNTADLPDFIQDILLGDIVKRQGILDPETVKGMVKNVNTNGVGPQTLVSDADRVFAVLVFSIWYNRFIEGEFFE